MIVNISAQPILPILIPALAAALSGLEEDEGGVAALVVANAGDTVDDGFAEGDECDMEETEKMEEAVEEEEEKDKEARVGDTEDEDEIDSEAGSTLVDGKDTAVVGFESPLDWPRAVAPQVTGGTPSCDVRSKFGVLAESSPEKSSICM